MAGIQANGIGSGLDVNSLVSQLVSAEGAPLQQRITRHEVAVTTKVSALGTLKGALAAFKAALDPLKTVDAFQSRKATSADAKIFTVTAGTDAVAGHYDVEVVQLAKAHQLASAPFLAGGSAPVGDGTLTISVGANTFSVTIDPDKATLDDIRNAINSAADNTGVQATLLNTASGSRLVLTASETGASNAIKVAASGGNGGLNQLVYDPLGAPGPSCTRPDAARAGAERTDPRRHLRHRKRHQCVRERDRRSHDHRREGVGRRGGRARRCVRQELRAVAHPEIRDRVQRDADAGREARQIRRRDQNGRPAAGRLAAALDRNRNATWAQRAGQRHQRDVHDAGQPRHHDQRFRRADDRQRQAHQGSRRRRARRCGTVRFARTVLRLGCPSVWRIGWRPQATSKAATRG